MNMQTPFFIGSLYTVAMSFLAGRLAATEGAYFLQQSKNAVARLAQNLPPPKAAVEGSPPPPKAAVEGSPPPPPPSPADVLPEILRHSIPIRGVSPAADSSLSGSSKWILSGSPDTASARVSRDVLNPLSAFVRMPQATFGPKRWQLPNEQPAVLASTANELRRDRYPPADPEKLKALAVGYLQLGKAFAIATAIVFGGATFVFAYTARKLQMASTEDMRSKGRDLIQPRVDMVHEKMSPLRNWVENVSQKWHIEGGKVDEKSIVKELSKTFSARTSN